MRNWDTRDESGTDQGCEWEKDWEDVQRVCRHLDIPCEMVRFSPFISCYRVAQLTSEFLSKARSIKRILEQSFPTCPTPVGIGRITKPRCMVQ